MAENKIPQEVAAAHGGLLLTIRGHILTADYEGLTRTLWGDHGFVQVLGGLSTYYDSDGSLIEQDTVLVHGTVQGMNVYDVHTFTDRPNQGKRAFRVFASRNHMAFVGALRPLVLPVSHPEKDRLREESALRLTSILEDSTDYSAERSEMAARLLVQHEVYIPYDPSEIDPERIFKESPGFDAGLSNG